MAKMGIVENGLKRRRKSRRRRNPPIAAKRASTAKKNGARRRTISVASARAVAKRNGLKLVSKSVANPKRKRQARRRNGIATKSYVSRRSNGFLGNTKGDAKTVGTVIGGAIFTKTLARIISPFVAPYASQVGIGNYTEILVDALVALFLTPFAAGMLLGKAHDSVKQARLGGLLVVGLSAIEKVAPSVLQYNPFVTSPVVMTGAGPGITPAAVAQIAQGVANDVNPQAAAAKVGNTMLALDAAGSQGYVSSNGALSSRQSPTLVL